MSIEEQSADLKTKLQDPNSTEFLIKDLFQALLWRPAKSEELRAVLQKSGQDSGLAAAIRALLDHPERQALAANVGFPPGHFYSPLVNISEVTDHMDRLREDEATVFNAINLSIEDMDALWRQLAPHFETSPFPDDRSPAYRFFYNNPSYPWTDAQVYQAMLQVKRPKRLIEVGAGFTSALLLDILDRVPDLDIDVTLIQPFPITIGNVLRPTDSEHYALIEKPVQEVDLAVFDKLSAGDFLFIDSTHVAKTGSDVVFEINDILPRLNPGVIVHFHDIFYPFEYPVPWVRDLAYSWNEMYMLRAYLQDNPHYRVIMFNNFYVKRRLPAGTFKRERFMQKPGGGFWIERVE